MAQSRVDAKTGLLNVSTWETEAETELSRAVRTHSPLALALVDIDHFKQVNDTYGHLVGDRVLKAIAEALTGQSRDYDKVGRFGGEEFVLLLAQTVEKDACKIAERLRNYVASLSVPADDKPDAPTAQRDDLRRRHGPRPRRVSRAQRPACRRGLRHVSRQAGGP